MAQPLAWWSTRHGSLLQAASCKLQAASCKLQAASRKPQAASRKPQAASRRADLPLAGAVAQRWRGGDRRHEARARLHARWRGPARDAVARQAACVVLSKRHDGRSEGDVEFAYAISSGTDTLDTVRSQCWRDGDSALADRAEARQSRCQNIGPHRVSQM